MSAVPTVSQLTLAATNVEAMTAFYDAVFACGLEPVSAYGSTLYRGQLHGVPLLLCPNSIAGVEAAQNRHQFAYDVDDIETVKAVALGAGATLVCEDDSSVTVADPDGNTIVFQGAKG